MLELQLCGSCSKGAFFVVPNKLGSSIHDSRLQPCNALRNMCCKKENGYTSQHSFQLSCQFIKLILGNVYQDTFVLRTILPAVFRYPARPSQLLYPDALLHPMCNVCFWLRVGLAPVPLPVPCHQPSCCRARQLTGLLVMFGRMQRGQKDFEKTCSKVLAQGSP